MCSSDLAGSGDSNFSDRDHAGDVYSGGSRADGILVCSPTCLASCDPDHHCDYDPGNGSDGQGHTGNDRKGEKKWKNFSLIRCFSAQY